MPTPAARLSALPSYPFAILNQRIRELTVQGVDVIRLDIGNPDMPPPDTVVEALYRSARQPGHHGYTGYRGTAEFREAVARYYHRRFGVTLDPDTEVLACIGSKEGIVNLTLAYIGAGDLVLVPDIGYPAYSLSARLAGGDVYWLPVSDEEDLLPNVDRIPANVAQRAKLLWVNYPNNPTGATVDSAFYQRMVDFCNEHDIVLASDNPYVDVTYDGYTAESVLQADGGQRCAVEFMSFSKTYNMGGWRLGAAVGSAEIIKNLLQVKSNVDSGHFQAVYDAGIAAMETTPDWIAERNLIYQARRDRMMRLLPEIGLHAHTPKGSMYVWGRVERGDGNLYAQEALVNAHVCLAPGEIYGPGGTPYVRLSVGMADARFDEALHRLKMWYATSK